MGRVPPGSASAGAESTTCLPAIGCLLAQYGQLAGLNAQGRASEIPPCDLKPVFPITMPLLLALLTAALLLPGPAWAQFTPAPGSYQLANGATGTATLRLVLAEGGQPTTVEGIRNGRKRTLRSAELAAFTIENHRFIRVDNFRFRSGADAAFNDPAILEVIETGAVELFYYHYLAEMGPNFLAHPKLPVLRKPGSSVFFAYSPSRTPGFDSKLAPGGFVAALFPADPVLQRQFAVNAISRAQLAAAVRAYNQGVRLKP